MESKVPSRAPAEKITSTLASYIAAANGTALPPAVVEKTKHHILDTLAACVSGAQLAAGVRAIAYVEAAGGPARATVIGAKLRASPIDAAFANGMMAHADETDDSHAPSLTHPGCAIVPAALAAAEHFGRDGTAFIRAVSAGYDVGCRVAAALGAGKLHEQHRSSHAIGGVFGAAAAAGALAGFDAKRCAWLLSYAAQQAAGLTSWRRDRDHIEKAFVFAGMPARNGMATAIMVANGFTAVEDTLDGLPGLFAAYPAASAPGRAVEQLGERHDVMHATIKRWCVGSPIQAALDSTLALCTGAAWGPDDVDRIEVEIDSHGARVVDGRAMLDVSLQHQVALMLADRGLTFASSHDEHRLADPVVAGLREKVKLVPRDDMIDTDPPRQAKVTIWLRDGTRLFHHTRAVRGTPADPMTATEVAEKALGLLRPVIGEKAQQLVKAVFALEHVARVTEFGKLLQPDESLFV
ncbi:MAG: MmgE/PrpD family protein [Xanthobacteraceae bacterium]|nr:MmgE/PrpD family protein [Xanthobacteraceae bacterium]